MGVDSQDQRIVKAARPLQDRSAAAAPAEDADARLAASVQVHFAGEGIGEAGDDKIVARLPKAEDLAGVAVVAGVEQGLVAGEIGGG